jgi:hypothetical protein
VFVTVKTHSVRFVLLLMCLAFLPAAGSAAPGGVSPYMPLQVAPEIERELRRLFVLAGMPQLRKPYYAADVDEALQRGCQVPSAVCANVRYYLERYMKAVGLTDVSGQLYSTDDTEKFVPNQRGRQVDSTYAGSASGFWQPSAFVNFTASATAYQDEVLPTAFVSFGTDVAQIDIGWRDRWWSPFHDSAVLLSTNARSSPSIGISNYRPLTPLKLRYEVFYADLEETDGILSMGERNTGRPGLFGAHLGMEPLPGWSLGVSRIMQFGGGGRSKSLSTLLRAFFNPRSDTLPGDEEEPGNQIASVTSRFDYGGRIPFSVYMEFAGEDTSANSFVRLGNTALSLGLFLPRITPRVDLTYEFTEFQNGWYRNSVYANGYTNDGSVMGHWAGNERVFQDRVAAQTHTLILNWEFLPGQLLHATYRTVNNTDFTNEEYVQGHELLLRYSRAFWNLIGGAEVYAGRTPLDETYTTVGVFLRW